MSWLEDYETWAGKATDAPQIFHRWAAYMTAASVMGRRLGFKFGAFDVYPNLYVLLLAPSSSFRKTTVLNLSKRVASATGMSASLSCDGSPEGFIEDLKDHPHGTLYLSEMASLLVAFEREYSSALKPLLTDLYDCPDEYRRRLRREEVNVLKPCLSIFGASVLDWILDRMRGEQFTGGFLARFVMVAANRKERTEGFPPPLDIVEQNRLVARLKEAVDCTNRSTVSTAWATIPDSLKDEFRLWAKRFERHDRSPILSAFVTRLQVTALKLALIEEVTANGSMIISADSFARAREAIEQAVRQIVTLEQEELSYGSDRDGRDQRKVLHVVKAKGEMTWTNLSNLSKLTKLRLNQAVDALREQKVLVVEVVKSAGPKPTRIVRYIGNGATGVEN